MLMSYDEACLKLKKHFTSEPYGISLSSKQFYNFYNL